MDIYEYKRAVRMLGDISLDDKAVVICRMTKDGQIVTVNCGDKEGRLVIQAALRVVPMSAPQVTTTPAKEEAK